MRLKLPYMGKIAGLALIQSTVSALGLLLTSVIWNKWESCHSVIDGRLVMYRTGLWEKCIDDHILRVSECAALGKETAPLKSVIVLMLLAISLQAISIIMGLIIRRYERQQCLIIVPIIFNFAAALCGTIGLSVYAAHYDKKNCRLGASYVIGWVGMLEVYLSCFLYILVAHGK
ncbi:uncharacterized protein LOC135696549 [Rhopilema esculentum]|uniref:uncharacterized protein LOC135696549 n=1 Tax=Rhopilema esculentum TaxID=499914 RepID=UPI0031D217AB